MRDSCSVGLVGLLAKLVECCADYVKIMSSILSCDQVFSIFLFPKGGNKDDGKSGREKYERKKKEENYLSVDQTCGYVFCKHTINTLQFFNDQRTMIYELTELLSLS